MEAANPTITVETIVNAPIEKVWAYWSEPEHIMQWCHASDDWHTPYADNDLRTGGKFKTTMAAKDGSFSFDMVSVYTNVVEHRLIEYGMGEDRNVTIIFEPLGDSVKITESFTAESTHSIEQQRFGWQAILDNFKKHTEEN